MSHSLINPNQVRKYGIGFWDNFHDEVHGLNIDLTDEIKIPLMTHGTKVGFMSRVPTLAELQDKSILRFEITSPTHWNPTSVRLSEVTVKSQHEIARTIQSVSAHNKIKPLMEFVDSRSSEAELASIDPLLNGIRTQLDISEVIYDHDTYEVPVKRTFVSTDCHSKATAEKISENFCIGLHRARRTMLATRQQGTRSAILPLER